MTKRQAVQKLKAILKEYEDCMITTKAARQVLEKIQKHLGMKPEGKWVYQKILKYNVFVHEWDLPEKKTKKRKK